MSDDYEIHSSSASYLNRELSQVDFIARVISIAEDPAVPLLERIKFLAISAQNLDHFFQVRVSGLKTQIESQVVTRSPDGRSPAEQLDAIRPRVVDLTRRQAELLEKELLPALAEAGVVVHAWDDLDRATRSELSRRFEEQIFAVLTPLAVDPAHPFPFISNLSLNLALMVCDRETGVQRFARVKIPPLLPRFMPCGKPGEYVPVEQVIAAHAEVLFPGSDILSCHAFRVTRDADLAIEESDADDLLLAVVSALQRRLRTNAAVRLEVQSGMSDAIRSLLERELELEANDLYASATLLDLGSLWALHGVDRPDLKNPAFSPVTPALLRTDDGRACDFFERLREGDVLVHHPYESFSSSVETFLAQAAADPAVLAIKHTLYRTSRLGNASVNALMQAAAAGKEVVTLIELTARFDEETNIALARALEQAGVHVVYGMVGLKAHGKTTLVVRREGDAIRRYGHIGTGNYNAETARSYEDLGLFTADPSICADLGEVFNYLTAYSNQQRFRKLWVAPRTLRSRLLELIQREADSPDGRIVIKANGLADPELIDAFYIASQAGVEIDLIIRGVCGLRPGVPGLSERIRVRSILGRFLEHSRIFRFGSDARGPVYAIGSADLMARNLDRRVEVVTPVEDAQLSARLRDVLDALLADDVLAWELDASGRWSRVGRRTGTNAQTVLQDLAARRAERSVPPNPVAPSDSALPFVPDAGIPR
ncbi:MAG: polyphosphate kinase 1 [Deltaproteobacteria bacterium]|nr:polyphosphate kinase 1 [Deltaproteobacteria bacterium]